MTTIKQKIAVIPGAFPTKDNPFRGNFIRDYIKITSQAYFSHVVLMNLQGTKYTREIHADYELEIHSVANKPLKYFKKLLYIIYFKRLYKEVIKITDIKLIHIHGKLLLHGYIGILIARKLNVPVIYSEHMGRFYAEYNNVFKRILARYLMKRFNAVTVVSKTLKDALVKRKITNKNIIEIGNPVDTVRFSYSEREQREDSIIYVGRFDDNKGILRIVKAFNLLAEKYPTYKLILIGDGNQRKELEDYLGRQISLKGKVVLTGILPKEEIVEHLKKSKVLVSPSLFESFGIAVAEAMAVGLPVVIGKDTGPSEYIVKNSCIEVAPNCIDSIARAVGNIIDNYQNINFEEIREVITLNYSFPAIEKKYNYIYNKLISEYHFTKV